MFEFLIYFSPLSGSMKSLGISIIFNTCLAWNGNIIRDIDELVKCLIKLMSVFMSLNEFITKFNQICNKHLGKFILKVD